MVFFIVLHRVVSLKKMEPTWPRSIPLTRRQEFSYVVWNLHSWISMGLEFLPTTYQVFVTKVVLSGIIRYSVNNGNAYGIFMSNEMSNVSSIPFREYLFHFHGFFFFSSSSLHNSYKRMGKTFFFACLQFRFPWYKYHGVVVDLIDSFKTSWSWFFIIKEHRTRKNVRKIE